MMTTLREVLTEYESASVERKRELELEHERIGDLPSLLAAMRQRDVAKLSSDSRFGLTESQHVIDQVTAAVIGVNLENGETRTVALTAAEFSALCDALVIALPAWGDEVRGALTVDLRLRLLDAVGVDERVPINRYEDAQRFFADDANRVVPTPGKYVSCGDLRVAQALHDVSLDGGCDDQDGSVDEGGWFGLIGQFVVSEDDQGFFYYEGFESDEEARARFEEVTGRR